MKRIASPLHIPAPKKRITTQLLKLPKQHDPGNGQPIEDAIYATKAEQAHLKMMGGSGKMTKHGIKSFVGPPGTSSGIGNTNTDGSKSTPAGNTGNHPSRGDTGGVAPSSNNKDYNSPSETSGGKPGGNPGNDAGQRAGGGGRAGESSGGGGSGSGGGGGGNSPKSGTGGSDPTNTPSGDRAGSGGNQPTSPSGTGGGGGGGMGTSTPSNPATSPSTGGTNTMQSVDQKLSTPTTPNFGSGAPTPTAPTTPGANATLAGMLAGGPTQTTNIGPKTSLPASNSLMGSISPTLSEAYRGLQSMFSGQVPAKPAVGSPEGFRAPSVASQLANPTVTPTSAAPPTSDIMGGVPPSQMTPEQRAANLQAVRRTDVQSPRQLNISGVANYLNTPGALADPTYTKQLVDASLAGERMFNIKGATPEQQALADQISHAALLSAGPASVDPRTIMGQALTESTTNKNPTKVSSLADKYNNLFGMKAQGPIGVDWAGQKVALPTKEMINGKMVTVPQNFKVYDNPMQSVYDYGRLMQTPHYANPLAGKEGVAAEIGAIRGAGYATHPADAYTKMVADRAAGMTVGGNPTSPPTMIASNQPTVQPANTPPPTAPAATPGINFGLAGMLGSGIYNAITNPTGVGQSITNAINQGMKGFKTASAAIDKYGGSTWAPKLAAMAGPDKLGLPSIIGGIKDATNSFMNSLKNPQAPTNLHSSPASDTVQKAAPVAAGKVAAASPTTGITPSTTTPTAAEVLAAKKLNDLALKPPTADTPLSTIKKTVVTTAKVAAVIANPIAGLSVLGAKKLYDVIQTDRANMQYLKDNYPETYTKEMARRAEQQAKTQGRAGSEKSGGNGTGSDGNMSLASKLAGKKKLSDLLSTTGKGSSTGLTSEGYLA